jgi:L-alanine-DL-glutamate epimerase-like enolase superfamily enzyme
MPHFELNYQVEELELKQPFSIARGTKDTVRNVFVRLTADGITGYGEASPNKRYDESAETVIQAVQQLDADFFDTIETPDTISRKLSLVRADVHSAAAMLEMAWLDWWAKSRNKPLWELWDAPSNRTPSTTFTIGLDKIGVIQQKVQEATQYPILKVKLGTDRDRKIIKAIREITDKPIRVDANEGWGSLDQAKEQISFLADQNIELIEQPMPAQQKQELEKLKKWSPLPLVADESFVGTENMNEIARQFNGINIKLSKVGSLVKGRNIIDEARKKGLDIMVGCMIESSLAIAAGALLGTWADYVDLDGHLLISNDPFKGLDMTDAKEVVLSNKPGLGVWPGY